MKRLYELISDFTAAVKENTERRTASGDNGYSKAFTGVVLEAPTMRWSHLPITGEWLAKA